MHRDLLTDEQLDKIADWFPRSLSEQELHELKLKIQRAWLRSREIRIPSKGQRQKKIARLISLIASFTRESCDDVGLDSKADGLARWLKNELLISAHKEYSNQENLEWANIRQLIDSPQNELKEIDELFDALIHLGRLLEIADARVSSEKTTKVNVKTRQTVWFLSALVKIWSKFSGQPAKVTREGRDTRQVKGQFADFAKEVGIAFGEVPADYLIENVIKQDLGVLGDDLQREIPRHGSRMKSLSDN